MTTAPDVGTPEWYRDVLLKDLSDRRSATAIFDSYYEGDHNLTFATSKFRRAFGDLFQSFADNWTDLVVDAAEERLDVEGFRVGDSVDADQDAWALWQRDHLDAMSQQGHLEALIHGEASVLVWQEAGQARLTVEHPDQMIVVSDPGDLTRRTAALKAWEDEWGFANVTLYLPESIFKWRRPVRSVTGLAMAGQDWEEREGDNDDGWPLANPLGVVPVVPLVNRPRLLKPGRSEIKNVIPVQDAVNKIISDMLVASEFQAFRQRWATGLELPRVVDEDGNEMEVPDVFQHAIDRLWTSEDPETTFGEFGQTDLEPFVKAVELLVQHIASQTRTPPHYFYLSGNFPSGESIKSAETGLVAKVRRKQRFFGEAWEEAIRLAFAVEGTQVAVPIETIWADPESRTEAEHIDAVVKRAALGVPQEQLWEDAGYSPSQVQRFREMQRRMVADQSGLAAEFARMLDSAGTPPPPSLPADAGE